MFCAARRRLCMNSAALDPRALRSVRRDYEFPQPDAPVAVREYLLTTTDEGRLCLLRFALREDIPIDCLEFSIVELDADGGDLASVERTLAGDELPPMRPGELFTPPWAFPVSARCAAVRVLLHAVSSGDYRYRVTPTGISVDYAAEEAWVYDPRAERSAQAEEPLHVRSLLGQRTRGLWPVAVAALLLLALIIASPYLERAATTVGDAIGAFLERILSSLVDI